MSAFDRPRAPEIRASPEFARLQAELWDMLRHEVEAHLAEQTGIPAGDG